MLQTILATSWRWLWSAVFATGLRWLWLTALVLAVDRISKVLIQQHFFLYESLAVNPFLNLTLAYNKGAAFSFLNSASGWQTWVFGTLAVVVSGVLLCWLQRMQAKPSWLVIALALVIGGALGNLWDRVSYGHVVDFIDLSISGWHWPIFNIADSAICIGTLILLSDAYFKKTP